MAEKRNGLHGQISADAHYGSFHFCSYCPWAMFFHWGCTTAGNARLVNPKDIKNLRALIEQISIKAPPEPSLPTA